MRSGRRRRKREKQRPLPVAGVEQIRPLCLFPLGPLWEEEK